MSRTNLFSRLAGYSQNPRKLSIENFCTEMLAHLFNHDPIFRQRFLEIIFSDLRMARSFNNENAEATTQETLGRGCRVDLVLRAGARTHLVEVKISAGETLSGQWGHMGKPQVQRYIDLGLCHVTYLTTSDSLPPEIDHRGRKFRMVKHALFEDLHEALDGTRMELTKMFLEFMEEHDMAVPRPFDRNELKRAGQALSFFRKCQKTLDIVRTKANQRFRQNIRARANLSRPAFYGGPDWDSVQSYLKYRKGPVRFVGMSMWAEDGGFRFGVWVWGNLHPTHSKIREHLQWKKDEERGCYSSIRLHGTRNDIARMINHADSASKRLGRAIRRFA